MTVVRNTPLTLVFVFSTFGLPRLDIRLSFFTYLGDRLGLNVDQLKIPPLADLVAQAA